MILANASHLSAWAHSPSRSRFDYDSPDHLLAEMMHERYFGPVVDYIRAGDIIHITDAATEQIVVRVHSTDKHARTVAISILEHVSEKPVTSQDGAADSGLTVRWRGKRGGEWCVLDKDGTVLDRDGKSKEDAERMKMNRIERTARAA